MLPLDDPNPIARLRSRIGNYLDFPNHDYSPRTETVLLPSGCSLVPQQYTRLQRSFLDLVEAARHFCQAVRCLWWFWLGVRAAFRESAICRIGRRRVAELGQKEGCSVSCATRSRRAETRQVKLKT